MYAEIILPLPLQSAFTYSVPPEMEGEIQTGTRVLVQFGKKKYYTGIVERLHTTAPGYDVKPILTPLDPHPVVRYPQLKLWNWISEYYLCSIGEVYRSAVPTGLKPESETYVTLNRDFEASDGVRLSDKEAMVVLLLEERKRLRISDIGNELHLKNAAHIVSRLLEAGIIDIDEKLVERYHSKTETFVELNAERGDHDRLHEIMDMTRRSRLQEKALVCFLDMSHWLREKEEPIAVKRAELMKTADVSSGIIRALVDKGIFRIEKRAINRFNMSGDKEMRLASLSEAQDKAFRSIVDGFRERQTILLHGLTGSGKTEIYTHLIAASLSDGNQVLYLVPEISLTTQLTDRLREALGDRLLVYHSKFSDSERVDIWKKLLSSREPLVVLGARSSVFLPFAHLGLVIVDEEHESSFKQYDPAPRYNARDTAIMLASMHGAKVVLGSATPSVETYYKAVNGKYGLVTLNERFAGSVLPEVSIVDMREQRKKKLNTGVLSAPLAGEIRHALKDHRQAILFQNRRGFAPVVVCQQCGWTPKCENCDVSPVYHKHSNMLKCHYCGATAALPPLCPVCGQNSVEIFGYGTERIAEEVKREFPESRLSRMDLDTTRNKDSYQEIIESFASHDTDILVGTQMVTKGLDFGDVRVAAAVNADTLLNFPDFRSNERAFNMLEQVAGRAGRRAEQGKVIIQTTDPRNEILGHVKRHDYAAYYAGEIAERERYAYPPFTKIINICLRNKDSAAAERLATRYALRLREIFGNRVLGPEKPFVSRVALWYIQSIMLKVESNASMMKVKKILRDVYAEAAAWPDMKTTQIYYDVDPV